MRRITLMLILVIVLFCSACSTSLQLDTTEKIKTTYLENEDLFIQAAEILVKYDKEAHIHLTREKEKTNAALYDVREFNGIYIEASDSLKDADLQTIYETCAPLFSAFEERELLSGFGKYDSHVEFMIEGPNYGNAAELYFFMDEESGSFWMAQTDGALQITPHWYAKICHY